MWLPVLGLVVGVALGLVTNVTVPVAFSSYLSIAILAALDTVLGGIRASLEKSFDGAVFLTGFFTNTLVAALLAYIGNQLGVDLYLAAVVAFGVRLFNNIAAIRRGVFLLLRQRKLNRENAASRAQS
ncbi:small basic family protein [Alicyclobacillus fastidiosus]|uniref:Small basic family protein n=1 Tax=Alicyclobacillus fastidiosus TaxID=392011 RepID=A0ABV5AH58_9BACL|nr:small basic family protein [Alicyclobacillus fastidiosus]WEH12104.1 small basic family protein [Alicyclobacillus fastidiosus]